MSDIDYFFQTEQLCVGYGGKPVVEQVEVAITKGQVLTLIGPNGSGKSTILKSIIKQLKKVTGVIRIAGGDIEKISTKDFSRLAAVVLTERPRPELMTCEDVVAAGRYPYTGRLGILGDEDRAKVRQAMETVHALDIKDRSFSEVSDGQLQRVMLARAICQEPQVIVLDEPTSFLDVRYAVEILDTLRGMADHDGMTVIMSLHELNFAKRVSDLVMCIKSGHVMQIGQPEDIFVEDVISRLYDLPEGYYEQLFGRL